MKKILSIIIILFCSTLVLGQNNNSSNFTEKKIENGSTYKKYKNGKLDSIIVSMFAENYGNALYFAHSKDEIRITNAEDNNSIITFTLKNRKQVKTFFYKNKPLIILENIDFNINNLPKNAIISSEISNQIVTSSTIMTHYEILGNDNPNKTFKLFYGLNIRPDLENIDSIFESIGDFFSEEDALLKIFYSKYAEKFAPQALAYVKTDDSGKIKDGIILDFKNKKNNERNQYNIYKDGKIIKSEVASLNDFQKVFIEYREKSMNN